MKEGFCLEVEILRLSALIIGSKGFGAMKRDSNGTLGSLSDYCVRHCICPVIVILLLLDFPFHRCFLPKSSDFWEFLNMGLLFGGGYLNNFSKSGRWDFQDPSFEGSLAYTVVRRMASGLNVELSKNSSLFGLKVWEVIGIIVGVFIVLILLW